jgi:hypothetical protein
MDNRRRAIAPENTRVGVQSAQKAEENGAADAADRQRDTAEYISEMILELRNLARANQLYTVMVPLEYAYYEAFTVANRVEVPPGEIERIKELAKTSKSLEQPPPGADPS